MLRVISADCGGDPVFGVVMAGWPSQIIADAILAIAPLDSPRQKRLRIRLILLAAVTPNQLALENVVKHRRDGRAKKSVLCASIETISAKPRLRHL